ncbi:accessory gene regulator B family protein [Paenibacillus elgii]|uniref:accessory gene regulator B family protein n=1 Tax=Paenibacillus elgii TaxID=189691 RepID=UPI003B437811
MHLALFLFSKAPDSQYSSEELEYGFKILINAMVVILMSFLISIILHQFFEVAIVLSSFALLRFFSGGIHLKSSELCALFSTFIICTIPSIAKMLHDNLFIYIGILTFVLVLIFAPSRMESHLKIQFRYINLCFKFISLSLVLINILFIRSDIITITFFVQGLLIISVPREQNDTYA